MKQMLHLSLLGVYIIYSYMDLSALNQNPIKVSSYLVLTWEYIKKWQHLSGIPFEMGSLLVVDQPMR